MPLSTLAGKGTTPFQKGADLVFLNRRYEKTRYQDFEFLSGSLQKIRVSENDLLTGSRHHSQEVPYFSLMAVVFLIVFRNLYYASFQKYFVSLVNNFEIDFNFQKIGLGPVFLGFLIVLLAFIGFFVEPDFSHGNRFFEIIQRIQTPAYLILYPLGISALTLFFLAFSIRIFPLIFSDLKVLFFTSFLAVLWRFVDFGVQDMALFEFQRILMVLGAGFFAMRSLLFYQVLRKAYRFRIGLTLFYICTLNLTTFLILFMVLQKETY